MHRIDEDNTNLMILLSFIILGHPDWQGSNIMIYDICRENEIKEVRQRMDDLVESGSFTERRGNSGK